MSEERAFSLGLPADPQYVATARLFGAAISRHFEFPEDAVEDLRLGISEACAVVMRDGSGGILVRIVERDGALEVEVFGQGAGAETAGGGDERTPQNFSRSVAGEMLEALFADARIEGVDRSGSRVVFTLPQGV